MDNSINKEKKSMGRIIFAVIFIVFTATCITFGVLCLHALNIAWITNHILLFSILVSALLLVFGAMGVYFSLKRKDTLTKTFFSGYLLVLLLLVVFYALQKTGFFSVLQDAKKFQEYLEKAGVWMPAVYILFQYLQVVILPIPAVVSTGVGVALFGPFYAMLYSLVGIICGSLTAFFIGRKLGSRAVSWIVGEDTLIKWQTKLKGKDNLVLTMMFLFPLFPDDVLCFIAGLSSMTSKYFCTMIVVSRLLSVSTTCYSLELIPFTTLWGLAIWALIVVAVVFGFLYMYKNLDKIEAFIGKYFGERKINQSEKHNKK